MDDSLEQSGKARFRRVETLEKIEKDNMVYGDALTSLKLPDRVANAVSPDARAVHQAPEPVTAGVAPKDGG